jgi:hypothetical protein
MNRFVATPVVACLLGLVWPAVMLDGQRLYVEFVWRNRFSAGAVFLAWLVVLYWSTRRIAELTLWRGMGAKLRLRERGRL